MRSDTGIEARPDADRLRRRRQGTVFLGLLLTFVAIFLLAILLPTDAGLLVRETPIVAAGLVALWLGGVLMGSGGARRPSPPPRR